MTTQEAPQTSAAPTALREFALPDLGEGLTEAEILQWLVAPGDTVVLNQPVVEVETAKAAVEVPTPLVGIVREVHAQAGDTVRVGAPLISVEVTGAAAEGDAGEAMLVGYGPRPAAERRRRLRRAESPPVAPVRALPVQTPRADVTVLAKPPVRKLARDLGIDLRTVSGTGPSGSITRDDLAGAPHPAAHEAPAPPVAGELHKPSGMHRAMAEAMTRSAFTAPHATVFLTVDATETMRMRTALRARPEFADVALTPLALIARAVMVAVRAQPLVNAGWLEGEGDGGAQIQVYDRINLGIAVATPRGLLVPNVKDAGSLTLIELAAAIAELTTTARDGRTRAGDLAGGTFSITNVGVFGVDGGTPILNPGESAILCLGTIKPAPWVHEGVLAVREVVQLSLSFDHRVIDGATAARFLADVGEMIVDPRLLLARS
jgi:2-oxoisovalerate dehydrogenase E2 component (dihydrolipoyl transacylase)